MQISRPSAYNRPTNSLTTKTNSANTRFGNSDRSKDKPQGITAYGVGRVVGSTAFGAALFVGAGKAIGYILPNLNINLISLAVGGAAVGSLLSNSQQHNEENPAKPQE